MENETTIIAILTEMRNLLRRNEIRNLRSDEINEISLRMMKNMEETGSPLKREEYE